MTLDLSPVSVRRRWEAIQGPVWVARQLRAFGEAAEAAGFDRRGRRMRRGFLEVNVPTGDARGSGF